MIGDKGRPLKPWEGASASMSSFADSPEGVRSTCCAEVGKGILSDGLPVGETPKYESKEAGASESLLVALSIAGRAGEGRPCGVSGSSKLTVSGLCAQSAVVQRRARSVAHSQEKSRDKYAASLVGHSMRHHSLGYLRGSTMMMRVCVDDQRNSGLK